MTSPSLSLTAQPASEAQTSCFQLSGSVDVDAGPVLAGLLEVDLQARLVLDFAAVQRVNSMGLAQILKVFDGLRERGIRVHVKNPNRMVGMLFKMTGMGHYLAEAGSPPAEAAVSAGPTASLFATAPAAAPVAADDGARLRFRVSLQSSQQLSGWYFFNTYLQRRLERAVHFEPVHGALGIAAAQQGVAADLVYAKPFDACALMLSGGFLPVLRPQGQTDEVSILVRADDSRRHLRDFAGARVAAATPNSFVYLLGRFLLDESGLDSAGLQFRFAGQEMKALQMLLQGEVDLAFMLSENYRGLSGLTRSAARLLDESESCFAFHLLCVAPGRASLQSTLREVLLTMAQEDKGRQVLRDMRLAGWCAPEPEELDMLTALFKRYPPLGDPGALLPTSPSRPAESRGDGA
ncbi:MAG: PhnD/SsuA/transferrin family substrate-binding protein [Pseudomonadota bacterium]